MTSIKRCGLLLSLMAILAFHNARIANAGVNRGPYLQSAAPTRITVRWRSDAPEDSRVLYGTNLLALDFIVQDFTVTNDHEWTLDGLSPGLKYYYAVGNSMDVTAGGDPAHYFVTPPLPGSPKQTRVWVLGDSGTANADQIAVRDAYENFSGTNHTDLWLLLGDNAYANGTDAEYQAGFFNIYTNMLRKSVPWPTLGNHDSGQDMTFQTTYPYFSIFSLPRNGECGGLPSGTEQYYSFDHANVHFVCLNSMTVPNNPVAVAAMKSWLTADLANTTQTWIVAYFHHPPYTKGSHDSDNFYDSAGLHVQMRTNVIPLLEAAGVDLVLSGHSHSYERSWLLRGHYDYSWGFSPTNKLQSVSGRATQDGVYRKTVDGPGANRGTVYTVAGSSGFMSGGSLNHPAFYISTNQLGSMVLDFDGPRLDAKFIRENGEITDFFTISKTNLTPSASNLMIVLVGDNSPQLQFLGSDPNGDALQFAPQTQPTNGLLMNLDAGAGTFTYAPAHGFTGGDFFTFVAQDSIATSPPATVTLSVLPPMDGDGDGMPDSWEAAFGLDLPLEDADGDGVSNLAEYRANTNPTDTTSFLRVTGIQMDALGNSMIQWTAVGGTRYRISTASQITGPFLDWIRPARDEISPAPRGTPATQSFTNTYNSQSGPPPDFRQFYRIRIMP